MKKWLLGLVLIGMILPITVFSHCQVPCGIYDDTRTLRELTEHVHTIEKAIKNINNKKISQHQKIRWVLNKEEHATYIQDIMQAYFLAQRIKPLNIKQLATKKPTLRFNQDQKTYLQLVSLSQKIIFYAMQTKQAPSEKQLKNLKQALLSFEQLYLSSKS